MPFSKSIRSNLLSVMRDEKSLNLFRQLTLTELQTFRTFRRANGGAKPSPSSIELEKLNTLIRLFGKNPINLEKILNRVDDLHLSTQRYLDFETKRLLDFELNTISKHSVAENRKTALAALENTRKYFSVNRADHAIRQKSSNSRAHLRIFMNPHQARSLVWDRAQPRAVQIT